MLEIAEEEQQEPARGVVRQAAAGVGPLVAATDQHFRLGHSSSVAGSLHLAEKRDASGVRSGGHAQDAPPRA